jgi:hypothetical protein
MIGASFDSTKTPLQELLARADSGKLQLPDFQRGWVWDDDRIKSLLASVSVSFPIGAVMLLETGGEHIRFKPRPLAGTHERLRTVPPETLTGKTITREPELFRSGVVVEAYDEGPEEEWDAEDPLEEAAS